MPRWAAEVKLTAQACDDLPRRGVRGEPFVSIDVATDSIDTGWMRVALDAASRAAAASDIPVGAVAVRGGKCVAVSWNEKESRPDPTGHAEILVLRAAAAVLGRWRLPDVTVYVTLEPCAMCAGAMVQARLGRLVFGATDPRAGAAGSAYSLLDHPAHNHAVPATAGVLAEDARSVIDSFIRALRNRPRQSLEDRAEAEVGD